MNMRQLDAFRAVFRAGSVSGGANILHTSQPSLSRLISDLEASIGFTLFTRGRRGMVPTEDGRRFHEAVERSFVGIDRLRDTARTIVESREGILNIGVIPVLTQSILPAAISRFQKTWPNQRMHISVETASAIISAVLLGNNDIGLVGTGITLEGVEILHKMEFGGICLVPKGHRQASSGAPLDLWDLEAGDFVSHDRPLLEAMELPANLIDRLLSNAMMTSNSTPTLMAIARATSRLAIVDQLSAGIEEQAHGLIARKLVQRTTHGLAVIKRHDYTLSAPGIDFTRAFHETAKTGLGFAQDPAMT